MHSCYETAGAPAFPSPASNCLKHFSKETPFSIEEKKRPPGFFLRQYPICANSNRSLPQVSPPLPKQPASIMDRDSLVFLAKLAEQAER